MITFLVHFCDSVSTEAAKISTKIFVYKYFLKLIFWWNFHLFKSSLLRLMVQYWLLLDGMTMCVNINPQNILMLFTRRRHFEEVLPTLFVNHAVPYHRYGLIMLSKVHQIMNKALRFHWNSLHGRTYSLQGKKLPCSNTPHCWT